MFVIYTTTTDQPTPPLKEYYNCNFRIKEHAIFAVFFNNSAKDQNTSPITKIGANE